jgi:transposase
MWHQNRPLRCDRINAPWVIDGPIDGEIFTLYVKKVLVPTLTKGDIVILDNLGSHKGQAVRRASGTQGHTFFPTALQPGPEPNRTGLCQALIRKAAPRTVEATWRKAVELLDAFPPAECANYLRNSDYASV